MCGERRFVCTLKLVLPSINLPLPVLSGFKQKQSRKISQSKTNFDVQTNLLSHIIDLVLIQISTRYTSGIHLRTRDSNGRKVRIVRPLLAGGLVSADSNLWILPWFGWI